MSCILWNCSMYTIENHSNSPSLPPSLSPSPSLFTSSFHSSLPLSFLLFLPPPLFPLPPFIPPSLTLILLTLISYSLSHTQPTHESSGSKKKQRSTKQKHALENSTGSDRVSSSARPAKRTFSLSRKPHPRKKSVYGSVNSLNTDPGYNSMPGHTRRSSVSRRSSPSFRSVRNYPPSSGNRAVVRSQSLRSKPKRRPKLHSLSRATASMYVEQDLDLMLPKLTLEESAKYEYDTTKPIVKNSSLRRSNSLRKSKSRSPIAPTAINSVYGTMHMYTVTDEIARRDSSPLATLSKYYLERLALGTTSFDMSLAIEVPKKEHTSFRSPIGVRQRPVSSLDMQLVAMRNDGTAASRLSNLRLKQVATARADEKQDSLPASNGPIGNGVILRKRIGLLGDVARPASASFVDPPTVKKVQASSRMSLRSHGGSLTDLTQTASPAQTPTQPAQPKRQAPQAPMRTFSRTSSLETPTSGHNTPKGLRKHSPLVASHSNPLSFQSHSSPHSSHDTLTGGGQTPNGRITPVKRSTSPTQHRRPSSPQLPMVHRNTSSPQLTMAQYNMNSHPHPPVHHNTSSSQIPVALISPPLPAALNSPQLRMAQHNASSPQFPVFHSNPNSPQRPMGHRNPSLPQSLAVHQSPVSPQAVVSPQSAIPQQSPMVYQNHAGSPVSPVVHCMPGSPQLPMIHRRPSSPQLPTIQCRSSSPQLPVVPHRTNSPQLPTHHRRPSSPQLLMIPIQEEESMATTHFGLSHTPTAVTPRDMTTPTLHVTNGHIPKVFKRQESLYISPRKQSLTIESMENLANSKHLRVSQILQTGGITGGDLSSSRLDLLEAIRKGIELKQVKQEEQERENLQNMPWDVAAILERRRVLEMDTGSSDDESNVTDWEDD